MNIKDMPKIRVTNVMYSIRHDIKFNYLFYFPHDENFEKISHFCIVEIHLIFRFMASNDPRLLCKFYEYISLPVFTRAN